MTTLPSTDPFRRRRVPDLRQESPPTQACGPATRDSPLREKACPGAESRYSDAMAGSAAAARRPREPRRPF
ncbi:hypothetical protein NDU88_002573 [Pleurodeles waltl]|uniref:Uncharacterized protein n=1 Tax=Pleurodeles waltl TaxID=8319 RepID=A0AAV7NNJ6_PLEWA|nr:hypothetical protein NDU88_002573 [Pleurodeles waltl]